MFHDLGENRTYRLDMLPTCGRYSNRQRLRLQVVEVLANLEVAAGSTEALVAKS